MTKTYKVVALNGSPHESFGNTSQMVAMLREGLNSQGCDLDELFLNRHHIEYCTGCALCLEKGACWIRDDHKTLVEQALAADAVILASPVYFFNVTGQMKTFLDRCLGYGHRPRAAWKPGLAVTVSAGWGETSVAQYLGTVMRTFGAFPIGSLTAMAACPGQFWGKEAVAARAHDLARDLAQTLKEGRRYPPTDQDLSFWHFMKDLILDHQDFMKADHSHWERQGLYQGFEVYVGQEQAPATVSPEMHQAWLKSLMERQKSASRTGQTSPAATRPTPSELRELLVHMPASFNPEAAQGLSAIYQFVVSGQENFTAHLKIHEGQAFFQDGPAAKPDVIIHTPADVWLKIMQQELDGTQAYLQGQFQVEGDISLLMLLDSLFTR
jgi:multimeric flavodoxin WrbA/putative sterol carrier protein